MRRIAGMRFRRMVMTALAVSGLIVGAGGGTAQAASTQVLPPDGGEPDHAAVLGDLYGGQFSLDAASGNLSNGDVQAQRIDDSSDQIVSAGTYDVQLVGKYGKFDHRFGYRTGTSGGDFVATLDTNERGSLVDSSTVRVSQDADFRWAVNVEGNNEYTSKAADNDGVDHFVTYEVAGDGSDETVRLLFVEDLWNSAMDRDYNDAVVKVSSVGDPGGGDIRTAPTPTAMGAGLLLFGLGLLHRRRKGAAEA